MRNTLNYIGIFFISLLLLSCSKNKIGEEIPKDMEITKISTVIENSKDYVKRKVLLSGNFASSCTSSSCCAEFYLNSGIHQIKVNYDGLKLPKIKKGKPIKVLGKINTTTKSIYLQLQGLEIIK